MAQFVMDVNQIFCEANVKLTDICGVHLFRLRKKNDPRNKKTEAFFNPHDYKYLLSALYKHLNFEVFYMSEVDKSSFECSPSRRSIMGEREMEIDLSSLQVLAKTSVLVSEGLLSLEVQSRPNKLPQIFWDKIQEMHGLGATLVLQKELRSSDVDPRQYRLSMPAKKIKAKFLTREESETLESQKGIPVSLIEPCLKVHHGLQLKRWMNDTVHFSYVLTKEWNDVAQFEQNGLKKDSPVQLWAFRVNGDLCFCLVNSKHPPAAADNYSVS